MASIASSVLGRAARRLRREAWVIVITLLALATRLYWNLVIHPPREHVFSDMQGYFGRADDVVRHPLMQAHDYLSFYPWGTHAFLGAVKWLFVAPGTCPREAKDAIAPLACRPMDIGLALLSTLAVFYTTLLARRLTCGGPGAAARSGRRRWVWIVIGLVAVFYYPFLMQSGYYLSEGPFFAGLAATTYHALRLADLGKKRDALLFGLFAGLAALVRPQILMSLVFLAVFWLFRRHWLPGATPRRLALAGVPFALILTFSAVRTTRHLRARDPDGFALIATNDALNYAFGRCHVIAIEAKTRGYRSFFGPPSLGSLHFGAKSRKKQGLWAPLELLPALPPDPQCDSNRKRADARQPIEPCLLVEGKMWDRDRMYALADRCVAATGTGRQLYYALTHVALNFGFNHTWPDASQKLRETRVLGIPVRTGRPDGRTPVILPWQIGFGAGIVPFAMFACVLGFTRRRAREGVLAMHIWASFLVAMLYFGETRLRTPYDFVFLILGLDVLSRIARRAGHRVWAAAAR